MALNNPHDIFFKSIFREKENVIDHLSFTLPKSLLPKIDLAAMELDNNSYLDDELKEYFSDIVYKTHYKKEHEVMICFLYEHKSYQPAYIHFQLLRYMLNIWDTVLREKESALKKKKQPTGSELKTVVPLPVVIPVIVYHGQEGWTTRSMYDYFLNIDRELRAFIPHFSYMLTDLSAYSNEEIKERVFDRAFLKIAFLLMKNVHNIKALMANLEAILQIGRMYYQEEKGILFLVKVAKYMYSLYNKKYAEFKGVLKKSIEKQGVDFMTILEDIELKAEKKGEIRDKQNVLIRQLSKKFGLTQKEESSIKSISNKNKLDKALDEILFAETKDQVLACLK
jgi:predicted transposase YdaD